MIETERLIIRPWRDGDRAVYVATCTPKRSPPILAALPASRTSMPGSAAFARARATMASASGRWSGRPTRHSSAIAASSERTCRIRPSRTTSRSAGLARRCLGAGIRDGGGHRCPRLGVGQSQRAAHRVFHHPCQSIEPKSDAADRHAAARGPRFRASELSAGPSA